MSLQTTQRLLGWPEPDEILNPRGTGPAVLAKIAKQKLQTAIRRIQGCSAAKVGIICRDPHSRSSQAPLAVVVEFSRPVTDTAFKETHRLAWNFARTPLLITIDPVAVRSWSCCEPPADDSGLFGETEIHDGRFDFNNPDTPSKCAAHALSWYSLISGEFFREPHRAAHFVRDRAADRLLLENLKLVRKRLRAGDAATGREVLDFGTIHALLARLMFLQFLADRRDAEGNAALNPDFFRQRNADGTLSRMYASIADLLDSKGDTYRLFHWLNRKFNGDLFPTPQEQRSEERIVSSKHLRFLAQFISGDVQLKEGQRFLWRQYSFDVIPLEFISSIYEEFIRNGDSEPGVGVVYTPPHLVDFILDGALPWDGEQWDATILDPACGSGIFLVKAYQRLVYRWKAAHRLKRPSAAILRRILDRCFGIDTEEDAIRVASFSLYLAMCDEIDPKRYWTSVRFPRLRGRTINQHDFFEDGQTLMHKGERRRFDHVIGNPPWGQEDSVPDAAAKWLRIENEREAASTGPSWGTSYSSIGPLFLLRAAQVVKPDGCVSLMQSSAVLLNDVSTARQFRAQLFTQFAVEEVANLSPLRYILFSNASKATSPPCVITFRTKPSKTPSDDFTYVCPKPVRTVEDQYRLTIGPYDVHTVQPKELISERNVLTSLLWGSRRDLALLEKVSIHPSLAAMKAVGRIVSREGVIRGDREKQQAALLDRQMLDEPNFPANVFLRLEPTDLPTNMDGATDSRASTNFAAFESPQLIIKQSWVRANGRFRAVRVPAREPDGVLCSQAYVSVHAEPSDEAILDAACLVYNSSFALYWLYLNNHRLASFISEATVTDILQVPLPPVDSGRIDSIPSFDFDELDRQVRQSLRLHALDWALIDDFFHFTLPDFKRLPEAPGPLPTTRGDEPELKHFCEHFLRILDAAFGEDAGFCGTIFQEQSGDESMPIRLVAVHLKRFTTERVRTEVIDCAELQTLLQGLPNGMTTEGYARGIGYQRVMRVYSDFVRDGKKVPTLYLMKPDQRRFWTASCAMRDADAAFNEIMLWDGRSRRTRKVVHEP